MQDLKLTPEQLERLAEARADAKRQAREQAQEAAALRWLEASSPRLSLMRLRQVADEIRAHDVSVLCAVARIEYRFHHRDDQHGLDERPEPSWDDLEAVLDRMAKAVLR